MRNLIDFLIALIWDLFEALEVKLLILNSNLIFTRLKPDNFPLRHKGHDVNVHENASIFVSIEYDILCV